MTVIEEVRALTGYDSTVISTADMTMLDTRAQKELEADVGQTVDFSGVTADSALFWLLSLFTKVHTGEIAAGAFSIGEVEEQSLDPEQNMWLKRYYSRRDQLVGSVTARYGSVAHTRDGREYEGI